MKTPPCAAFSHFWLTTTDITMHSVHKYLQLSLQTAGLS